MNTQSQKDTNVMGEVVARNFQLMSSFHEKLWDMWMVNMGSMSWLNDQWEEMFKAYLTQRKQMRDEMVKVTEHMASQLEKNLQQVEEMVEQVWKATAESVPIPEIPNMMSYAELVKQVNELSKKIEEKG